MCNSWRRLCFYFDCDIRFKVFSACSPDGGRSFHFDGRHVSETLQVIRSRCTCDDCADAAFGRDAMRFLAAQPERAHRILCGTLALVCVGSGMAERQHLLGQETKFEKSRGAACRAETIAQRTYVRSAVAEAANLSSQVHKEVLASHRIDQARYTSLSRAFRLGGARWGPRDRNTPVRVRTREEMVGGGVPRRSLAGWHSFRKQKWAVRAKVGTDAFIQEEQRLSLLWSNLSPDEKAVYEGRSAAVGDIARAVAGRPHRRQHRECQRRSWCPSRG